MPDLYALRKSLNEFFLPLLQKSMQKGGMYVSENHSGFELSERFLQVLWNEQRWFSELTTSDGRKVKVHYPGVWNNEPGPDFSDAVIEIDGVKQQGMVEIHFRIGDWKNHGHHLNEAYDGVILHVVWKMAENEESPQELPPCVEISSHLKQEWMTLFEEFQKNNYPRSNEIQPGRCALNFASKTDNEIAELLNVAGLSRFERKVLKLQRDICLKGCDQALYEAFFAALGYKNNQEFFRKLAERCSLKVFEQTGIESCEYVLFGTGQMLPDPSVDEVGDEWLEQVKSWWQLWWKLGLTPVELECKYGNCRPYNSPHRRLAAGINFLRESSLKPVDWLIGMTGDVHCPYELKEKLLNWKQDDNLWNSYSSFKTRLKKPAVLLGNSRKLDMCINIFLPFLSAYARTTKNKKLQDVAEQAYLLLPKIQKNSLIEQAVHRLFIPASRGYFIMDSACKMQGIMEIYKQFCLEISHDCKNCALVDAI